jgi:hypothetical protein
MVNRIWLHHFGQGLVRTPNDFGTRGAPPSHPELLDYLARRFIESGWSIKAMHRLILTSRTYRLASSGRPEQDKIDPSNVYLWRHGRRRLDAEAIRDSLLAISGELDPSMGAAHPFPPQDQWNFTQHAPFDAVYETNRRSVYLMQQRLKRHSLLALFDGADPNASTAERAATTTPVQALFWLNDPFVHDRADKVAELVHGSSVTPVSAADADATDARLRELFLRILARGPTVEETRLGRAHLQSFSAHLGVAGVPGEQHERRAWASLTRALWGANEFLYVD